VIDEMERVSAPQPVPWVATNAIRRQGETYISFLPSQGRRCYT